jgi:hypothetical protein
MKLKMTEIWQRQPSGDVIITTTKWAPLKRLLPRRDTCILEPFGLMRTWQ